MADAKDTQEKGLHVQETSSSQSGSTHSDAASNENKDMEKGAGTDNEASIATKDPDAVDWDGPDDPANPRNWTRAQKMANIVLVSLSVLYCNLATTMFSPGANIMQKEFGFTNTTVEIMTITISSLGFGLGQMFAGPASEVFGRLPIYRTCAIFYLGFTAGCSQSTTVAEFIVFRLLAGMAASPFMTTGGGTIADILPKEERGAAMAIFSAGPLFGPVIGPIAGGFITQYLGWRWTFYIIMMLAGVVTITCYVVMRETSAIVLLRRKAARLRKETGNPNLHAIGDKNTPTRQLLAHAMIRPMKFLIKSPVVVCIALYLAFAFGLIMLLFATFPTVYEGVYGWSVGISGLSYLGVGIGCALGAVAFARYSDRLLRSEGGAYRAERRLVLMMYASPLMPAGMFVYGWTTRYAVHWIVPMIATAVAAPGAILITSSSQLYIIDIFGPEAAASALGAVTLLRNVTGAFLPLAASPIYANLGLGWGNSLLAFLLLLFVPVPFLFYRYGEFLRKRFPVEI